MSPQAPQNRPLPRHQPKSRPFPPRPRSSAPPRIPGHFSVRTTLLMAPAVCTLAPRPVPAIPRAAPRLQLLHVRPPRPRRQRNHSRLHDSPQFDPYALTRFPFVHRRNCPTADPCPSTFGSPRSHSPHSQAGTLHGITFSRLLRPPSQFLRHIGFNVPLPEPPVVYRLISLIVLVPLTHSFSRHELGSNSRAQRRGVHSISVPPTVFPQNAAPTGYPRLRYAHLGLGAATSHSFSAREKGDKGRLRR